MKKNLTCAIIAVMLSVGAGVAAAGGSSGTIGVGAEATLSGLGGPSINYDGGKFHVGGFLAFEDEPGDNNTDIAIGGRFFWHLHSTPTSDFSFGGNLGIEFDKDPAPAPDGSSFTLMFLEPAVQLRAFISGNVALSATMGLSIGLSDADGVNSLRGQLTGGAGIHYYFF